MKGQELGLEQYRRSVKENKKASILAAAHKNFLKNGFSRAAMADIAREADVSTATLYKHFGSKEELFAFTVSETYGPLNDEFNDIKPTGNAREVLYKLMNAFLAFQFEKQVIALMRIVIAEVPTAPEVAINAYNSIIIRRYAQLASIADNLMERKLLKPHDTKLSIMLLIGMIREVLVWPALFDANVTLPANADAVIYEAVDNYLARYGA